MSCARPRNTANARCEGTRPILVLAGHQAGLEQALGPKPFAQALHQRSVLGPALGEDVAHAVQHQLHGREVQPVRSRLHEGRGLLRRVQRGVGKELVGQRLDAGLARHLALGAALGLVGQIKVFQLLLGRRGIDGGAQLGCQLALLLDALQHRGAALLELAQVRQARLELAQLDVVEAVGRLLAVARDEGHGGAPVEQFDGGLHLVLADLDLGRELANDFLHG
jgi:hypothetical protein